MRRAKNKTHRRATALLIGPPSWRPARRISFRSREETPSGRRGRASTRAATPRGPAPPLPSYPAAVDVATLARSHAEIRTLRPRFPAIPSPGITARPCARAAPTALSRAAESSPRPPTPSAPVRDEAGSRRYAPRPHLKKSILNN